MIISDFTTIELNQLEERCNFIGYELYVFKLRGQGKSHKEIAEILGLTIDKVKKFSSKVNKKIIKAL